MHGSLLAVKASSSCFQLSLSLALLLCLAGYLSDVISHLLWGSAWFTFLDKVHWYLLLKDYRKQIFVDSETRYFGRAKHELARLDFLKRLLATEITDALLISQPPFSGPTQVFIPIRLGWAWVKGKTVRTVANSRASQPGWWPKPASTAAAHVN